MFVAPQNPPFPTAAAALLLLRCCNFSLLPKLSAAFPSPAVSVPHIVRPFGYACVWGGWQLKETKDLKEKRIRLILLGRMLEVFPPAVATPLLPILCNASKPCVACWSRAPSLQLCGSMPFEGCMGLSYLTVCTVARRAPYSDTSLSRQDSHTLSSYGLKDGDYVHAAISEEVPPSPDMAIDMNRRDEEDSVRGFDRLLRAGFSQTEVDILRTQFHSRRHGKKSHPPLYACLHCASRRLTFENLCRRQALIGCGVSGIGRGVAGAKSG